MKKNTSKKSLLSKRQKTNIIIFAVSTAIAIYVMLFVFLLGHDFGSRFLGGVSSAAFGWFFTIIINAWIFNWAAKKFFDKFFGK